MSDDDRVILHRSCRRVARQPIRYGAPVRFDDEGCDPSSIDGMNGVAKRGGIGEHQWEVGEAALVLVDGQVLLDLDESIELVLGGVMKRLLARQPVMVRLVAGRIVGLG